MPCTFSCGLYCGALHIFLQHLLYCISRMQTALRGSHIRDKSVSKQVNISHIHPEVRRSKDRVISRKMCDLGYNLRIDVHYTINCW